jgi:endonuclease/exonuclease/phosphatase family metal-dependent hydrolase
LAEGGGSLRLLTLNIWNYNRNWPQRRQAIAGLISELQPDAVALQECRHDFRFDRGRGQGEQLADCTGYYPTVETAQVYTPLLKIDEGLTFLTKQQPELTMIRRLERLPRERQDENQRICLGIVLEFDASQIALYNTHFSLSARAQELNAREVTRFIDETSAECSTMLLGDLNATPDSAPLSLLMRHREGYPAFQDCWQLADQGLSGKTYPSWKPVRRIDFVLARNFVKPKVTSQLFSRWGPEGTLLSDHAAILCEIELPPSN